MKRTVIALALALAAGSALADAPPEQGWKQPVPSRAATRTYPVSGRVHHGYRHGHHGARVYAAPGPVYGREPAYYPGYGNASPNAGFGATVPVSVTLYREAYIGPGLVYNTPPEPRWRSDQVISVRY